MAHLPYADLSVPELQPLVQRIVAERGHVLHLYQMLMHSPPLAEGWLHYLTQVRQKLNLDGALRELVIMQIAHLNGAPYEAEQHAPIALREGLVPAQLAALPHWQATGDVFSPLQQAALALAATMTSDIPAGAEQRLDLQALLGEREVVELVGTIAAYNMVSRFLEALNIHADDPRPAAA